MKKIKEILDTILSEEPEFTNNFDQVIDYNKVKQYADNLDELLIRLLIKNATLKEHFFKKIEDIFIFKVQEFKFFLDENRLNNSYTQFANRIGLADRYDHIIDRGEVVLNFPYKDCVLEAGQTKEDQKRNEIFYNEIMAQDEIDRLLDRKAFVNWKRFDQNGEQTVDSIKRHPDGTIAENLLIKGNNLIALHSLKEQFAGKVKLIYIDPPYNTGNDSFGYNDRFNHSTWLVFMKNRLEVARELLRDDGCIFVQCDDNEQAYLKVLMDEVFGRNNFINCIIPVINPRGRQESAYPIAKSHEYILCFSKQEDQALLYNVGKEKNLDYEKYRLLSLRKSGNASLRRDRPNMFFPIYYNEKSNSILLERQSTEDIEILPIKTNNNSDGRWRWSKENIKNNTELLVVKKNSKNNYDVYVKDYLSIGGELKGHKVHTFIKDPGIINDKAKEHLETMFNENIFNYPKSEILIKIILEFTTAPYDIILDYHLGSGTTATVAHKMNRQYIGIEQIDYIEIAQERLKKVIDCEQGGISKSVNWQGGGDFVYMELAKWNQKAKELFKQAANFNELKRLFDECYETYFLNYNLKIAEFKQAIETDDFQQQPFDEQKSRFIETLDMNQMYIHESEMSDKKFSIPADDQRLTREFYGG